MLICKFASPTSQPQRIRDWLEYLDQLAQKHGDDRDAAQTLQGLMVQARGWLGGQAERERGEAGAV